MGCQSTKCAKCGGFFPACQLVGGLCARCRGFKKMITTIWHTLF